MNWLSNNFRGLLAITLLGFALCLAAPAAFAHCGGKHTGDHPHCAGGDDGGGGGGDTGAIPLNCRFADGAGDSILSDGLGDYQDDVDKVLCTTGDSQEAHSTSHIRLYTVARGHVRNAVRKADLAIDETSCTDPAACAAAPDGVFEAALSADDMEDARFWVRAYAGTDGLEVPHIQSLTPGQSYEVAMGFSLDGTAERWLFQMMGREAPADFKEGATCAPPNPADAISEDVSLYVWPDNDSDGRPDGYTLTTAAVLDTTTVPPTVDTAGLRTATLCSNVGIDGSGCGGPGGSDLCHLISQMEVQFTWHSVNQ